MTGGSPDQTNEGSKDGAPDALLVRGLVFTYPGASSPTVVTPDLTVGAGEQVVLTGPSGRGKSTLLHLVAGLMEPNRGTVLVGGRAVSGPGGLKGSARDRFRGRHIGMVFQTFQLLHGFSALENVLAALMFSDIPRGEHRARGLSLLERLGIERPHAPAEELSVGQRQRVAVARALACRPALVLADEPTASLDPENAAAAIGLLQQTCREHGAALLCVTHDPALAISFDRRESLDAPAPGASGVGAA